MALLTITAILRNPKVYSSFNWIIPSKAYPRCLQQKAFRWFFIAYYHVIKVKRENCGYELRDYYIKGNMYFYFATHILF